jgi:hypothetical protein
VACYTELIASVAGGTPMMSLDNALWLAGLFIESALVCLLYYRRAWRLLPVFSAYCAYDLISNLVSWSTSHYGLRVYSSVYLTETVIDSLFGFCVLVELGWSVLRPIRKSLPNWTVFAIGGLILIAGAAVWPFSEIQMFLGQMPYLRIILHTQQTASILRILVFVALAAGSQLLSIGWKDRELQVATGLGFYSLVSLGAAMLRTHGTSVYQYSSLNEFVIAGYLCSLLYWTYCFAHQQAERRDFTPQMRDLLLAMTGVARSNRMALSEAGKRDSRDVDRR